MTPIYIYFWHCREIFRPFDLNGQNAGGRGHCGSEPVIWVFCTHAMLQ
uniref:Uncharacterized protein n=1 Tax=Anguilla anguilla TaxID=7936 RepID=A0A0E9T110_ANGAN